MSETVKLGFDPFTCDCEATKQVFQDSVAVSLYLLWRRSHIVNQHFANDVLRIVEAIRKREPKTAEELKRCFPRMNPYGNFPPADVNNFCEGALPYIAGEKVIKWVYAGPDA